MTDKLQKRLQRTEEALHEREAAMRAVVDAAAEGIITVDASGILRSCNGAAQRMFAYGREEMVGRSIAAFMSSAHGAELDARQPAGSERFVQVLVGGGREIKGRRKDGTFFPLELAISESAVGGGKGFVAILRDLTRQRQLERHVAEAALAERRSLAQDLHDSLGGQMSGMAILADLLRRALEEEGSAQVELATELCAHIRKTHGQVRQVSRGLHPVDVDPYGLMAALRRLVERIGSLHAVSCRFDCPRPVSFDDNSTATHMFGIVEEALQNAIRHSGAANLIVGLESTDGAVTLWVSDDGVGFDPAATESQGMGLRTMRYRAEIIGGRLIVGPGEGGGTRVACTLPARSR